MWGALSALSIAAIFTISVGALYLLAKALAFLQPILVPFAIAGVMAYLLEPVVAGIVRWGKCYAQRQGFWPAFARVMSTRLSAVWSVFLVTTLVVVGFLIWFVPVVSTQTSRLAKKVPEITYRVRANVAGFGRKVRDSYGLRILPDELLEVPKHIPSANGEPKNDTTPTAPAPTQPPAPADTPKAGNASASPSPAISQNPEEVLHKIGSGDWVNDALPSVFQGVWSFFSASLGGFLGFFGFLLSLIIVPLYLFYLLTEFPSIATGWSKYLPLRTSAFKDEVVDCLEEINGYLIAFFRGQLVVSLINGAATGLLLAIIGLDFGGLIGFALCFLGIIPYIGIAMCWIPAVLIASVQGGSWLVPSDAQWWAFPLVVTGAFAFVQQVDALFVTPKIVGERVGLHPATVIFSVFLWSLLLGGLLGAILAVPLTATLKVILKRYVWERTLMADPVDHDPVSISEK